MGLSSKLKKNTVALTLVGLMASSSHVAQNKEREVLLASSTISTINEESKTLNLDVICLVDSLFTKKVPDYPIKLKTNLEENFKVYTENKLLRENLGFDLNFRIKEIKEYTPNLEEAKYGYVTYSAINLFSQIKDKLEDETYDLGIFYTGLRIVNDDKRNRRFNNVEETLAMGVIEGDLSILTLPVITDSLYKYNLAHELGHNFGKVNHSKDPKSLMYFKGGSDGAIIDYDSIIKISDYLKKKHLKLTTQTDKQ